MFALLMGLSTGTGRGDSSLSSVAKEATAMLKCFRVGVVGAGGQLASVDAITGVCAW